MCGCLHLYSFTGIGERELFFPHAHIYHHQLVCGRLSLGAALGAVLLVGQIAHTSLTGLQPRVTSSMHTLGRRQAREGTCSLLCQLSEMDPRI